MTHEWCGILPGLFAYGLALSVHERANLTAVVEACSAERCTVAFLLSLKLWGETL